jgi:hypothetical protein
MNCPFCNEPVPDGARVCGVCKRPISSAAALSLPAAPEDRPAAIQAPVVVPLLEPSVTAEGPPVWNYARPASADIPHEPMPRAHAAERPAKPATEERPAIEFQSITGHIRDTENKLLSLVDRGYELYAIFGLSQFGKTQFMRAVVGSAARAKGINRPPMPVKTTGAAESTDPGQYNAWSLRIDRRLIAIWDIAGENFKDMTTANVRHSTQLVDFVCATLPRCRGLLLNLALHKLWAPWNPLPNNRGVDAEGLRIARERLQDNIDLYTRMLAFARIALAKGHRRPLLKPEVFGNQAALEQLVAKTPRLKIPVIINFSMADLYRPLMTPRMGIPEGFDASLSMSSLPSIAVDPARHNPLVLLALYLPELYHSLVRDARYFKADFSHAFDGDGREDLPELDIARACRTMFETITDLNWRFPSPSVGTLLSLYRRTPAWKNDVHQVLHPNARS